MRFLKYQILTSIVMVLLMWILTAAQSVPPQRETLGEKCSLSIAQAPELRGFHLGMSMEEVKARFPQLRVEDVSVHSAYYPFASQAEIKDAWRFEGLEDVY